MTKQKSSPCAALATCPDRIGKGGAPNWTGLHPDAQDSILMLRTAPAPGCGCSAKDGGDQTPGRAKDTRMLSQADTRLPASASHLSQLIHSIIITTTSIIITIITIVTITIIITIFTTITIIIIITITIIITIFTTIIIITTSIIITTTSIIITIITIITITIIITIFTTITIITTTIIIITTTTIIIIIGCCCFETASHYVALTGMELTM
ncbi:hypothetical protein STEG23_029031 [Scotinomys teguina]